MFTQNIGEPQREKYAMALRAAIGAEDYHKMVIIMSEAKHMRLTVDPVTHTHTYIHTLHTLSRTHTHNHTHTHTHTHTYTTHTTHHPHIQMVCVYVLLYSGNYCA